MSENHKKIAVKCSACGLTGSVSAQRAGQQIRCRCGAPIVVGQGSVAARPGSGQSTRRMTSREAALAAERVVSDRKTEVRKSRKAASAAPPAYSRRALLLGRSQGLSSAFSRLGGGLLALVGLASLFFGLSWWVGAEDAVSRAERQETLRARAVALAAEQASASERGQFFTSRADPSGFRPPWLDLDKDDPGYSMEELRGHVLMGQGLLGWGAMALVFGALGLVRRSLTRMLGFLGAAFLALCAVPLFGAALLAVPLSILRLTIELVVTAGAITATPFAFMAWRAAKRGAQYQAPVPAAPSSSS